MDDNAVARAHELKLENTRLCQEDLTTVITWINLTSDECKAGHIYTDQVNIMTTDRWTNNIDYLVNIAPVSGREV